MLTCSVNLAHMYLYKPICKLREHLVRLNHARIELSRMSHVQAERRLRQPVKDACKLLGRPSNPLT